MKPERHVFHLLASAAIAAGAAVSARAAEANTTDAKLIAYGRHLAGECSSCHRIDGVDNGIPSITGWDPDEFVATLIFYRNGERPNPAMVSVAQSMDEPEYKALAAYYATLPKPARGATKK